MTNSAYTYQKKQRVRSKDESVAHHVQSHVNLAGWTISGCCVLFIAWFASEFPAWKWMYHAWTSNPNYSHGLLVPAFSIWLLWHRRERLLPSLAALQSSQVSWVAGFVGVSLVVFGIAIECGGIYTRTITLEALSILLTIAGAVLCCGGWQALRWAWPSVCFLLFMIPLPGTLGGLLSGTLQSIATSSSTYFLQIIGIPAVSEGNIIWLTEKPLGVAEACSGIRMLTTFFALAVGMAFVVDHPALDKCLIVLSAPFVAILANLLRITLTAVAYEFGNQKIAELIFHDLAGWLMMPAGLLMLWLELFFLSKIFTDAETHELTLIASKV